MAARHLWGHRHHGPCRRASIPSGQRLVQAEAGKNKRQGQRGMLWVCVLEDGDVYSCDPFLDTHGVAQ